MTQVLRNDEIEEEELGLQMQPFNHGDPQPMKSLTSSEAPGFQMQFRTQLTCSKYSIVFSIEAVATAWPFTTEMRKALLRRRSSAGEKAVVEIMLDLVWQQCLCCRIA